MNISDKELFEIENWVNKFVLFTKNGLEIINN